jgi:hypothetical protein
MTGMTLTIHSTSFLADTGQGIDLFPAPSELTVAQAAKILDMSEACVNDLLNIGVLKFRQESDVRLVMRDRLMEYERSWKRGNVACDELVRMDQEMGLYDD